MLHQHTNHHIGHPLLHARHQLRQVKVEREEHKKAKSLHQLFEMVRAIKVARDNQKALRRANIDALKQAGFYQAVCQCVGTKRWFDVGDFDALASQLSNQTSLKSWQWEVIGDSLLQGILMFSRFDNIAPALLFETGSRGFELVSFHFDYASQRRDES